ncbi:threonine/serine exporter family protein [Streptococcus anginosus]|uniref:Threonine/serine exporter family protein n=2 Tax=Streptococcus anginosus TaxID=1328 RepID=A0AAW5THX3_STRAP|nr:MULTISPECIES: threonine/serine exporter family protein [Streptococcus]KAB0645474.1 threonine/serine exporter family protein [Aerococcus sanguinicola]KAA9227233.1 threonine/serine exporter family protein [Streptococcus anginosus]KAA9253135.1 threonine/serine exporter family protein [Streptococcus anginosus]KAA9258739.1 threonine/serine exporter family protein [Streptococcus anginosus]KAA9261523.1 threonine/serine exporter family protein [Streptococcus anginosus]
MKPLTVLLQAAASFLAIVMFLIVLNIQKRMLIPGGILGMFIWLLYYVLKGPTNVIIATFIAAIIGSCISQVLSILYKTPAVVFILAILAPLVPGYLSYRTTAFFVTGDYSHAMINATLVVILALVISIGMASGTVVLRLYHYLQKHRSS